MNLNRLLKACKVTGEVFIETGTQNGKTMRLVCELFKTCHGIEVSPRFYQQASKVQRPHVRIYLGHSPDVLPNLLEKDRKTVFWLDAHYIGGPQLTEVQCPLMEELKVITGVKWSVKPTILIDDARFFEEGFWKTARAPFVRE